MSQTTRESPRMRRLRSDFRAMQQLAGESSILKFSYRSPGGDWPADAYMVRFSGTGLERTRHGQVVPRAEHEVTITLGAGYPRSIPELSWRTPIFHPNISASGVVCLGGYSTHWAPSLNLDQLCVMLWDMIRYANYDVDSPYNREAAMWARTQQQIRFPVDNRALRDRRVAAAPARPHAAPDDVIFLTPRAAPSPTPSVPASTAEVHIIQAEVVESGEPDILFID